MKTTLFSSVTAITAGALLLTAGCKTTNVTPDSNPITPGELRISASFADQTSQFAFDLTKRVSAQEGQDKNVFISPLSLHMALGMLLNGANGQTAQEIQKTLKLNAQTLTEANQTYQSLLENLPKVDPNVTLNLANSVWYRNTFTVENAFQNLLKQTFQAEVSAQDFNNPSTVEIINSWASEKTKGKIPKVLDQIQSDNVMFLLNALYFKGNWKTQFDPSKTIDASFKLASGKTTNVRMMRLHTDLKHTFQPTYAAFELPYGLDKYAMTILLPTENTTADALINNLNSSDWTQLQKDMTLGSLDIGLPKFTLNYEINLNNALSAMGMPTAFTDRADFTKINAKGGLLLSFVKQNTFVAVDEEGTEAAAVTSTGVTTTSIQVPTLCDRPFVFIIHEKTTGTVLFVGKIAEPTTVTLIPDDVKKVLGNWRLVQPASSFASTLDVEVDQYSGGTASGIYSYRFSGKAAVNTYITSARLLNWATDSLDVDDITTTKLGGSTEVMQFEKVYYANLKAVNRYELTDKNRLKLYYDGGVLVYEK